MIQNMTYPATYIQIQLKNRSGLVIGYFRGFSGSKTINVTFTKPQAMETC